MLISRVHHTALSSRPTESASAVPGFCRKDDPLTAIGDWINSVLEYGSVTRSSSLGSSGWSSQYTFETESGKKVFAKIALGEDVVMFKGEALGLSAMYGKVQWNQASFNW